MRWVTAGARKAEARLGQKHKRDAWKYYLNKAANMERDQKQKIGGSFVLGAGFGFLVTSIISVITH